MGRGSLIVRSEKRGGTLAKIHPFLDGNKRAGLVAACVHHSEEKQVAVNRERRESRDRNPCTGLWCCKPGRVLPRAEAGVRDYANFWWKNRKSLSETSMIPPPIEELVARRWALSTPPTSSTGGLGSGSRRPSTDCASPSGSG